MTPSWRIIVGDAAQTVSTLPAASVQCCVTSPPYYSLRDYGVDGQIGLEDTPDEYVQSLVDVFREVRRVLRDDGTVWLNLGDSYAANRSYQVPQSKHQAHDFGSSNAQKVPSGLKAKDLIGVPWLVAFALRADGWYLRQEIIWHKCLSGGARVYARTQKGDMPMMVKDLVRLDPATVKLWNGERWTQVVSWERSEEPRDGALEIELRSGERVGCTQNHVWPTERGNVRADELAVGDVIATTTLPEPDAPATPAAFDLDVAWLCGRYLADGSSAASGKPVIACHAEEAADLLGRCRRVAAAFHGTASITSATKGNGATVVLHGPALGAVIRTYIYGTTAHVKGLTGRCWQRDNRFLYALLLGYLSGDGHYDAQNDRWRLGFTRNDRLAGDIRTLAARIDAKLTLKATTAAAFGQTWPVYRGELRLSPADHHNTKDRGDVLVIRPSRARRFWDIAVADDPHLFALASGVLTHNSAPMPESVRDRCTRAHEQVFMLSKRPRYFYDADAIKQPSTSDHDSGNGYARDERLTYGGRGQREGWKRADNPTANRRSVWTLGPEPYADAHFAVMPGKLARDCVLAGSPEKSCGACGAPWERVVERRALNEKVAVRVRNVGGRSDGFTTPIGGVPPVAHDTVGWRASCEHDDPSGSSVVLDPFSGAGTTGVQALRAGRSYVGVELNAGYAELARNRIRDDAPLMNVPAEDAA